MYGLSTGITYRVLLFDLLNIGIHTSNYNIKKYFYMVVVQKKKKKSNMESPGPISRSQVDLKKK